MADEQERLFSQLLNLDCPPADFSFIPDREADQDFVDTQFDFEDETIAIGVNANHYYEYSLSCLQATDGGPNRFYYNPTGEVVVPVSSEGRNLGDPGQLIGLGQDLERTIQDQVPTGDFFQTASPGDVELGEDGRTRSRRRSQRPNIVSSRQLGLPTERLVTGTEDNSIIQGTQTQNVQDPFRLLTETVWFYSDNRLGKLYQEVDFPYISSISSGTRIQFNQDGSIKCRLSDTYFPDRDTALVTFANNPPFVFGEEFTDHYFILNVPFGEGILNDLPLLQDAFIAYSKSKYNFYDRTYEEGARSLDERLLHNYTKDTERNYIENFDSVIRSSDSEQQEIINRNNRVTYNFEETKETLNNIGNDGNLSFLDTPMLNSLIFQNAQRDEGEEPNPISKDQTSIDKAYSAFEASNVDVATFSLAEQVGAGTSDDGGRFSPRIDLRLYDYETFFDQLEEALTSNGGEVRFLLGRNQQPRFTGRSSFITQINEAVETLTNTHFRTTEKMFNLEPCYNRILFYRIEKRKVTSIENTNRSEVIQNFLIPYTGHDDLVKFIDSQVKYGQRYDYQVYAYNIVIGNKYSYEPTGSNYILHGDSRLYLSGVSINNVPSRKIVEVPFTRFTGVIYDAAPLPTSVEIYPSLREERKVSFFLEDRYGEEYLNPIIFDNEEEEEKISLIRISQEIPSGPLLYRGDDTARAFQVFRSSTRPESKLAMQNFLIDEVDTTLDRDPTSSCRFRSRSVLWDDTRIEYNRKYYYMFRTIDIHNSYSNPSDIYEVELVETLGHVQLVTKVINPEVPKLRKKKSFRKYLRITPALEQMLLSNRNQEEAETVEGFAESFAGAKLGPDGNEIWTSNTDKIGKDIKLLITSKKTGSKMEIVLKYIYTTDNGIKYEVC